MLAFTYFSLNYRSFLLGAYNYAVGVMTICVKVAVIMFSATMCNKTTTVVLYVHRFIVKKDKSTAFKSYGVKPSEPAGVWPRPSIWMCIQ